MTTERYRDGVSRTDEQVAAALEAALQANEPDAPVVDGTYNYALVQTLAATVADQQEQSLSSLYESAYLTDATDEELTKKAEERGVQRQAATASTGVVQFQRDSAATADYTVPSGTIVGTGGDDTVRFTTTESVTLSAGDTTVSANVRCTETGPVGNVGANTIVTIVSGTIQGIDAVTNPNPTGDPSHTLTDGQTPQRSGRDRESDESLRERALAATSVGGAASDDTILTALRNLPETISVTAKTNSTSTDNTGSGGLPPYSTEIIVYGGDTALIVAELQSVMTIIDFQRLVGGIHGTKETYDVRSDLLGETVTGEITRPTRTEIDVTVDLVTTEDYAGTDVVKDTIVEYLGGFTTDNTQIRSLGLGEDIVVDELESRVTDVTGVRGITSLTLDRDDDGTDDTTTDSDGLSVLSVSDTEIVVTDAQDGSITVNTTET